MYTRKLVQKGVYINHDRDRSLLARLDVRRLLQTDFLPVHPDDTLGELVHTFRHASRNLFPVVDDDGHLLGVVSLDTVRDALFDDEHYTTTRVRDLMDEPLAVVRPDDTLLDTLRCMEQLGRLGPARPRPQGPLPGLPAQIQHPGQLPPPAPQGNGVVEIVEIRPTSILAYLRVFFGELQPDHHQHAGEQNHHEQ